MLVHERLAEAIRDRFLGGETPSFLAVDYDLPLRDVYACLRPPVRTEMGEGDWLLETADRVGED